MSKNVIYRLRRQAASGLALVLILSGCATVESEGPSATPSAEQETQQGQSGSLETEPGETDRPVTRVGVSFDAQIPSSEVMLWVEAAVAEMSDPPADFMGLIWPIGEALDDDPDPEIFDGAPFRAHSHVLSSDEVEDTVRQFEDWQLGLLGCTEQERRDFQDGSRVVGMWIRGAADVATAPDPCLESRAVIYARTAEHDKTTATEIFFHEAYHGLSNYLLNRCSPILGIDEDDLNPLRWFAEGTADYFGVFMAAKLEGREDHRQKLLERAYLDLKGDPSMTLFDNTYVQSAAMILMLERSQVSEEKILDGSYFHNCEWIEDFAPEAKDMQFVFDNFNTIEVSDGVYRYPEEAISG